MVACAGASCRSRALVCRHLAGWLAGACDDSERLASGGDLPFAATPVFKPFPRTKLACAWRSIVLAGESYFGQYGPNIATYILDHNKELNLNLKGMALGNACWGGNETYVLCNGYNADQNDISMYFGKGLMSEDLYNDVFQTCNFTTPLLPQGKGPLSKDCVNLLEKASQQVGWVVASIAENERRSSACRPLTNQLPAHATREPNPLHPRIAGSNHTSTPANTCMYLGMPPLPQPPPQPQTATPTTPPAKSPMLQ